MRRLVWVAVGATLAVVVARRSRDVVDRYVPADAARALTAVGAFAAAARTVRSEFSAGLAEREDQLRHDLIGDVDVDELRATRARTKAEAARADAGRADGRPARAADPTEDPDDADGDLPYSFF